MTDDQADEWGVGCYERTASELAPVSGVAIAALGLTGGERVLDVACGTGNAALLAREKGAIVTGVDASRRLLEVARQRVPDAKFVHGDAVRLPFAGGCFDAAVSVFGVIFARPGERAAVEITRVVRPGGRVVISTWPPRGPLFAAVSLMRRALARARPPQGPSHPPQGPPRPPEGPSRVDWGDPAVLERLLGPYGDVEVTELRLAHEDAAPEEVWDRWERLHPMWINARRQLEPAAWDQLRETSIAALAQGGLGAGATSPYLLAVLERR